jgi:predicted metal-dependent HD superfamily phosphohydrolase
MIYNKRSISTRIERVFRKRQDGLWQELINHFIDRADADGNKVTKLDKSLVGRVYKEAAPYENSLHGEYSWTDPETGNVIRLISLSNFQQGNSF